jgi:copper transport protein
MLGLAVAPTRVEARAAHAQYDHSVPAANARLASGHPPASVQVWFTEQVEPDFSNLVVYNQARQRVDAANSHVAPNNSYSLIISLRPHLPDGAYTVVYQTVSLDDGHHVVGAFSFVVGNAPLPTNSSALLGNLPPPVDQNFNVWSITIRWLNYLGVAALAGGVAFLLFVWRPTFARPAAELRSGLRLADEKLAKQLARFLLGSLLVLGIGWVAMLLYQASASTGESLWQLFSSGTVARYITESHFGATWLIRLGLLVLAVLAWVNYARRRKEKGNRRRLGTAWLLLLLSMGILLTTSLNSHAAGNRNGWLLFIDVLHLFSASFWIGGLLALILLTRITLGVFAPGTGDRTRFFARIIPRFSLVAIVSVIVLVITGTIEAIVQLGSFAALLNSSYGQALDIKIFLLILLLCLGAYNLLRVSPRMNRFTRSTDEESNARSFAAGKLQRKFRGSIMAEALVMVLLLLVVGGLTSLSPPPSSTSTSASGGAFVHQGQAMDLNYRLVINPGKIGENTIEVALTDANGQPVHHADAVIVRFQMLDMDMGIQEEQLHPIAGRPGDYTATGSELSMAGNWGITLVVRRAGFDDAQTSFRANFQ